LNKKLHGSTVTAQKRAEGGIDEIGACAWQAGASEKSRRRYLAAEFVSLFIVTPLLYLRFRHLIHPIPLLWCVAALSTYLLYRDGYFSGNGFREARLRRKQMIFLLERFVFIAAIIGLFTILHDPGRFLSFPKTRTLLWLIVLFLYPILSVVPQGIVFRAFIFHRYGSLFGKGWGMIAVSGLTFSFAHLFYLNPVAALLTFAGGIMFAHTYLKSGSLWVSSMEHALYGDFIFTIGLGYYIYSGVVR
jgi:membrane protease YdiL (CAAX protease family)